MNLNGAVWRKSRRSTQNGSCVELAAMSHVIAVRDSKNPEGGHLLLVRHAWTELATAIKDGRHDL
ncbi:DUF397 domain-containing protein [Actinomadura sp. NPDC047616]|uniref:DUF397 domain-containing protein n=1 Tax=Actinomadura sp. NPDC047616 TaxID=3155914 RepID=UPI0033DB88C4